MNHFIQKFTKVGYIKPIGQKHVIIDNVKVDKDVKLFQRYFDLSGDAQAMSPIVVGSKMTRQFIEDSIDETVRHKQIKSLKGRIVEAYNGFAKNDFNLIEGTGHTGVGSVMGVSNAGVANLLNSNIIMVINGGIGNTIDQFELNHAMCKQENANIVGIVVNKVLPDKYEQTHYFLSKYLQQYNIPLIGTVPYVYGVDDLNDVHLSTIFIRINAIAQSHKHYKHVMIVDQPLIDAIYTNASLNYSNVIFIINGHDHNMLKQWYRLSTPESLRGCIIVANVPEANDISTLEMTYIHSLCSEKTDVYITDKNVIDTVLHIKNYTVKFSTKNAHQIKMVIDHYSSYMDFSKICF